jgi:hypothetical protein
MLRADGSYQTHLFERKTPEASSARAEQQAAAPSTEESHRRAETGVDLALKSYASVERGFAAAERRRLLGTTSGVGAKITPGGLHYGSGVYLSEAQLRRGLVVHGGGRRYVTRLACFVREAARRRVTVAALGGSVTSGLPFGTFTGEDHANAHWLYHRKLARWTAEQWPATNAGALNSSHNCGLPAVGPAFSTLCLGSLLPPSPDLVVLEYAINLASPSDAEWFELLARRLRVAYPRAALLALNSIRLREPPSMVGTAGAGGDKKCISEQHICETYGHELRGDRPTDAESAIERVCRHYSIPLVSLRRAIGDELGGPPFVPSNFLKDCAHPNPQGHSWLAQLLVHALRRAAAPPIGSSAWPSGETDRRCEALMRPRHSSMLPPPLLLRGGAHGSGRAANSSTCLHGTALAAAVLPPHGSSPRPTFTMEAGRKPGLRAHKVGSVLRLRVRLGAGVLSTWTHLGYLQSWRSDMGNALVSCEPPCECGSGEQLNGYSAVERTTTTKIRALQLRRRVEGRVEGRSEHPTRTRHGAAGPDLKSDRDDVPAAECVLRIQVVRGGAGGGRFVVSDLISGSDDPGPLTWAFDVAGQLLLHR